jgi:uncharacterized protein (TIGR01777 family)
MAGAKQQHWLITGGTGFIGSELVTNLLEDGHRVTVLTRNPEKTGKSLNKETRLIRSVQDINSDAIVDVMVNLAGEPLFSSRWTRARKRAFFNSRLTMTADLVSLVNRLKQKPTVMISGSAIGFYGMHPRQTFTESNHAGGDEMARLCQEWETAARPVEALDVRLVLLRTGLVLDKSGGMLSPLLFSSKLGLGTRLGTGKQWMSWITRSDLVRMIRFIAETKPIAGPVNGTAPNPVSQVEFADQVSKSVNRPRFFWAPAWVLRLLLGEMSELLLYGQKVLPEKIQAAGFSFKAADIETALDHSV